MIQSFGLNLRLNLIHDPLGNSPETEGLECSLGPAMPEGNDRAMAI